MTQQSRDEQNGLFKSSRKKPAALPIAAIDCEQRAKAVLFHVTHGAHQRCTFVNAKNV